MNLRSRVIIGLSLVALGMGVVALGFVDQESDVRYVDQILDRPAKHMRGEYTLLGMPQPATLSGVGEGGATDVPNPSYRNSTQRVVHWLHEGIDVFSTLTLTVDGPDAAGISHWSLRNETRAPGHDLHFEPSTSQWQITRPHMVFLIQGFATPGGDTPYVFGVYEGVLREPVQPKPSQFKGHVASELPGGVALPEGAVVYMVKEYTAGCSSKFLPPELKEEYKDDPDFQ